MKHHIKIDDETMAILRSSEITTNSVKLPQGLLPRPLYEKVNKVLVTAGGKWNHSAQSHLFTKDPREALGMAIETGEIKDVKKATQAFYTPVDVADILIDYAEIKPLHDILEPSAGMGGIASRLWVKDTSTKRENHLGILVLIELDPDSCRYLRSEFENQAMVIEGDFLLQTPKPRPFDRVIMNPPFTTGQDVSHVTHAFGFLKPGGRLVAIMSPGWEFKTDRRSKVFRELVEVNGHIAHRFNNGEFKESGTAISTVVVVLDKPAS